MYTLDDNGRVAPVQWPKDPIGAVSPFRTTHILATPLTKTLTLLMDTFNDSLEIVDSQLASRLLKDQNSLPLRQLAYFRTRFALEGWLPRARARYEDELAAMEQNTPRIFAIVPTFECNMRCTYCYQQHDPFLDRSSMTTQELLAIFDYLLGEIEITRAAYPQRPIILELFGGEPFLPANKALVKKVFEFARANRCHVTATTNGFELDQFYDIVAPYHGYISTINITLDGRPTTHEKRRAVGGGSFDRIVRCINNLLLLKIRVSVGLNIDRKNVDDLEPFLQIATEQGWTNNPLVILDIGRVDDRKREIGYAQQGVILSEAELLERVLAVHESVAHPSNLRLSFLKTTLGFARRLGLSFNQDEFGRLRYHYCWATSPGISAEYLVPSGQIYRCTYTVGDSRWVAGTIRTGPELEPWFTHGLLSLPECQQCPLGGACSGGCRLSAMTDPTQRCQEEWRSWNYFVNRIVVPRLKSAFASANV